MMFVLGLNFFFENYYLLIETYWQKPFVYANLEGKAKHHNNERSRNLSDKSTEFLNTFFSKSGSNNR